MSNYKEDQAAARKSTKPLSVRKNPLFTRATMRRKLVNRLMTKKGYMNGIRVGSKEYNLIHAIAKRQSEEV